jgi:integrase
MALTDSQIRAIKGNGKVQKISDSQGLSIRVSPDGKTKTFSYAFRSPDTGKEKALGIGRYGDISLADARKAHQAARSLLAKNICPVRAAKEESEARIRLASEGDGSFKNFAERWVKHKSNDEKNPEKSGWSQSYKDRVEGILKRDVYPHIGKLKLADVKPMHVRSVLLSKEKFPSTALKVKALIGEVFDWAIGNLYVEINPATPIKPRQIIKVEKAKSHEKMTEAELGAFMRGLAEEAKTAQASTINAIKLLVLSGTRKNEVRMAEWSEIFDLDFEGDGECESAEWRIPGPKMKMREDHTVPLSKQCVSTLRAQYKITGGRKYIFTISGKPPSRATFNLLFKRLSENKGVKKTTVHSTRATLASALREHGFERAIVELLLAHSERGSAKPYHQISLLPERRKALQYYADLVDTLTAGANVIPMKRVA